MTALTFFEELLVILSLSLFATLLFRRFNLSPIIAYVAVGCLTGPYLLGWVDNSGNIQLMAEFGVSFLLFTIGLEFSLSRMLALRFAVFGIGLVQVLACSLVFALAVYFWGASLEAAIIISGALALSSTAIVTRELSNQRQFNSRYAQLAIGVLLFQDLAAVIFLILVPVFAGGSTDSPGMLLFYSMGKGLLLFILLMAAGKWLLPHIYHEVARTNSEEIFVLSTLVIALLTGWLTHSFGLSMALGGFVTGMMLSETSYKHQISNDIRPFRDILLGLFFVSVGLNIELTLLYDYWFRIVIFSIALVAVKIVIVATVVRIMGESVLVALRVSTALAQAGEFGLALVSLAFITGIVPADQASFIILIAITSMLVSPMLIRHNDSIARYLLARLPGAGKHDPEEISHIRLHQQGHVVIGGFGRVGQTIAFLLETNSIPYTGIDLDINLIGECRKRGSNVIYGDCTRLEILESCHIAEARLAILTFRSIEMAKDTINRIRKKAINVPVIVRCYSQGDFEELISIGANWVIPEMLEASLIIGTQVLKILEIEPHTIDRQIESLRVQNLGQNSAGMI